MSFLAGRLGGKEAAYFFQESKHAVTRLAEKKPQLTNPNSNPQFPNPGDSPDVLPEILRHSLPSKIYRGETLSEFSSEFSSPKWSLPNSNLEHRGVSPDVMNPLRGYVSLPQVTFGVKRWQLPTSDSSVVASTANELRPSRHTEINPEKIRAATEGLAQIGMAFAGATAIIFGSAILALGLASSKYDIHGIDDVRARGKDLLQPKFETIKDGLHPLRDWADQKSKKWHIENGHYVKEIPFIKELSKMLGSKSSA